MPTYKVHVNHIYEEDQWVEVEADNEHDACDKAEHLYYKTAYDHAMHTSTTVLEIEEVEE